MRISASDGTIAAGTLTLERPRLLRRGATIMRSIAFAFAVFLLIGNLGILLASAMARHAAPLVVPSGVTGVRNVAVIDEQVWRGGAPTPAGYRSLAANGVTTIVDLRAEEWVRVDEKALAAVGLERVTIPIRDGQVPTPEQLDAFLGVVKDAPGRVFVHCGAGVGRTGTMAAAYLVATGQAEPAEALRRNLAVGPPSLEQIVWVSAFRDAGGVEGPGAVTTVLSRILDGPRRTWHALGF